MNLRTLEPKDAPLMLEWMHDLFVVEFLRTNFASMTLDDCERFIKNSITDKNNLHLAITADNDEYMGTVSLKNITGKHAEFAICMRRTAMGKGLSHPAMEQILEKGFVELRLDTIYWYVSKKNERALRFYEKHGYIRTDYRLISISENFPVHEYIWFQETR